MAEMIPMTVRFSPDVMAIIEQIATEHGMTKADIVRITINDRLEKYIGNTKYVDEKQGAIINKNLVTIGNLLIEARDEMHRIGVNYNQVVRLRNIEAKRNALQQYPMQTYEQTKRYFTDKETLDREEERIKNGSETLQIEKLEQLIERMERVVERAGEILCTVE